MTDEIAAAKSLPFTPPLIRFGLLCTLLFSLGLLLPDRLLVPLNLATASLAAELLRFFGAAPVLQGAHLFLPACKVVIVTECTGLYPTLLFCSFVAAYPASLRTKASGMALGAAVLNAANIARIAAVLALGSRWPGIFEIAHVYLAQIMMVLLVFLACLLWLNRESSGDDPASFALRTALLVSLLFLPWLALNRLYVALLDRLVQAGHALLWPGFLLNTPRPFAIYNHTFAVPFFVALVAATSGLDWRRRLIILSAGVLAIAAWHSSFRATHVLWTAHGMDAMLNVHQVVYLLGQYLLPVLLWLLASSGHSSTSVRSGVRS